MIPYSRPKLSDLYTLSQSKLFVTIHSTAAHTYMAHIWQYPPPPPDLSRVLVKDENLFFVMTGI